MQDNASQARKAAAQARAEGSAAASPRGVGAKPVSAGKAVPRHAGASKTGTKAPAKAPVKAPAKASAKTVASKKTGAAAKRASKGGASKRARRRKARIKRILGRVGLCLGTLIALVLVAALGAGFVAFKGPSQSLGDLLTITMQETSALKFVPRLYYSSSEMNEILARNQVSSIDEETDASMIVIAGPTPTPDPEADAAREPEAVQATPKPENLIVEEDGIEIYEVHGSTYNGWMMIVQDPSRITVGVCRENFSSKAGLLLHEIAQRYNAVAAINGGGFSDSGGMGNGGKPLGLVISNGEVLNKANINSEHAIVMGFDENNVLRIGKMTADEAKKRGMRDALAYGPALVVNGEPAQVQGASSGLNPRTAIGQRADGAVLMLVIDGRQASSLGATFSDLISVMLEYGAINAGNLDGGSSSLMYYKGEYMNKGVLLTGSRKIPTGFIVR